MSDKNLDDVLRKWACSIVMPLGGEPESEYDIRRVHGMMTHGVKLLQLAQSPAYNNFRMQEIIDRVKELSEAWNDGKSITGIGMRMELIKSMINDLEKMGN
jgi:hypothetical protein